MTAALLASVAFALLGWIAGSRLVKARSLDGFEDATSGFKRWREAMSMREGKETLQ